MADCIFFVVVGRVFLSRPRPIIDFVLSPLLTLLVIKFILTYLTLFAICFKGLKFEAIYPVSGPVD